MEYLKRALIIGGDTSLVGRGLNQYLSQYMTCVCLSIYTKGDAWLNLDNEIECLHKISNINPDYMIIVSFPLRDYCSKHTEEVKNFIYKKFMRLIDVAIKLDLATVFISSQDVFRNGIYNERSIPIPLGGNLYGDLKAYVEETIRRSKMNKYYIVRFGVIYGGEYTKPHNFVYKILHSYKNNEVYYAYKNQFLSHTYLPNLVFGIKQIITEEHEKGVYHLSDLYSAQLSRYDVALKIKRICGLKSLQIEEKVVRANDIYDMPFNLQIDSIKKIKGYKPIIFEDGLSKLAHDIKYFEQYI